MLVIGIVQEFRGHIQDMTLAKSWEGREDKIKQELLIWLPFPTEVMFKMAVGCVDVQFFISNVKIKSLKNNSNENPPQILKLGTP